MKEFNGDSKAVHCSDSQVLLRFEALRKQAREVLEGPFTSDDYLRAEKVLGEAASELKKAEELLEKDGIDPEQSSMMKDRTFKDCRLSDIRFHAGKAISSIENIVY